MSSLALWLSGGATNCRICAKSTRRFGETLVTIRPGAGQQPTPTVSGCHHANGQPPPGRVETGGPTPRPSPRAGPRPSLRQHVDGVRCPHCGRTAQPAIITASPRGVAQLVSARGLGPRGPQFESGHPDHSCSMRQAGPHESARTTALSAPANVKHERASQRSGARSHSYQPQMRSTSPRGVVRRFLLVRAILLRLVSKQEGRTTHPVR